jgi:hypothetical protein
MRRSFALSPARWARWLTLAGALACPACSGGLHTVRGKVLYDGSPIKGAVVIFHPKGGDSVTALRPTGVTDENGVFSLVTIKDDGAPTGDYQVTVTWPEPRAPAGDKLSQGMPETVDRLKGRYANPETSGLTATIKQGANELAPFELKKVE